MYSLCEIRCNYTWNIRIATVATLVVVWGTSLDSHSVAEHGQEGEGLYPKPKLLFSPWLWRASFMSLREKVTLFEWESDAVCWCFGVSKLRTLSGAGFTFQIRWRRHLTCTDKLIWMLRLKGMLEIVTTSVKQDFMQMWQSCDALSVACLWLQIYRQSFFLSMH